jgi:hypothetical protein
LKQDDDPELQSRPRVEILRSATDYDAPPSWEEEVADLKQEMENDAAFHILTGIGPSDVQLVVALPYFSLATQ